MVYYSIDGKVINNYSYPDYNKTKYVNWNSKNASIKKPVLYNKKEECCGCFSCYSICAKKAIIMEEDLEGFVYPVVDLSKCIGCCNCEKYCPIEKLIECPI